MDFGGLPMRDGEKLAAGTTVGGVVARARQHKITPTRARKSLLGWSLRQAKHFKEFF